MTAQAEAGVWLVSECPIENGTLLKTERVVSLHATADEALSEVRRQSKIMRDNDLRGYLYGYKFYPVPGLLAQQPAPESAESITVDEFIRREAPNWAGVDAQAYVRSLRGGNESVLAEENRRLREALEFYAADANWGGLNVWDDEADDYKASVERDHGARARLALSAAEAPAGRDG